jgi:hypothetical protein
MKAYGIDLDALSS